MPKILRIRGMLVLTGNIEKGKAAYLHFFALWKDADPDIPFLKAAKAECAKLQ